MFKELVIGSVANRPGRIVPIGQIGIAPSEEEKFCSIYSFNQDFVKYVQTQGTVADFPGKAYCDALWFDIDLKNEVEQARITAVEMMKKLNMDYSVNPDHPVIYFSGNKGFHIAIPELLFGQLGGGEDIHEHMKKLAREVAGENIKIDTSIYDKTRIFRWVNSRNAKSGLYKIPLTYRELCDLHIDEIRIMAQTARTDYVRQCKKSEMRQVPKLAQVWANILSSAPENYASYNFTGSGFFQPAEEGERNNSIFRQAAMLFDKSELSREDILDIMISINYASGNPIPQSELERTVRSAYQKTSRKKVQKEDEPKSLILKTYADLIPEWIENVTHESSPLSLKMPSLDKEMKGKLRGKLCVIAGYGGSKKSLYALNVCLHNIREKGVNALYNTMEMSETDLFERITNHIVEMNQIPGQATEYLAFANDNASVDKYLREEVSPYLDNKLQITGKGRLTYDHYNKLLKNATERIGNIDMLVVDGLSLMGGKGTETELYSHNSAELKKLANEWNIFVMLICHVSKGGELHTRDVSRIVRGSEKILDNCDFYISMSQLIDEGNSTEEGWEYRQDKGYLRLVNKRGSGKAVNLIYDFLAQNLNMVECPDDPRHYEVKKKKGSKTPSDSFF